jgi:flagellar biosynthesis protein FlhF
MNFQRFTAPTSREALAKARMAFGEGTLILSNRQTANGVEVVATAEHTLAALDQPAAAASRAKEPQAAARQPARAEAQEAANPVAEDAAQLAMSTLSFQDYVRERMLRRRQESVSIPMDQEASAPVLRPSTPAPAKMNTAASAKPIVVRKPPAESALMSTAPAAASSPAMTPALSQGIVDELHAMKELIEDRFNTLTWLGQARQNPIQSNWMLKLIRSGYSPTLARTVLERMPNDIDATESIHWVMDVLQRNLKTDAGTRPLHEEGGTFALVGATGVGKTTTAAKLAGLCARTYGSASVGLITLDTYRVGAHEQLRAYGRMLGVVAHLAHDRAALQDLLSLLSAKKMVLIDTTGLAPRDPRKRDMLDVLDLPNVNRLLVLNAGGHGDTLDDVVASFKSSGVQQAILSKIDEAVKLGPALDASIRHQLLLRGVTTGQKVPEDWESADAAKLVRMSMRAPEKSAFDPKGTDLGFFFTQSSKQFQQQGRFDA